MALKEAKMQKVVNGNTQAELAAASNESILITDVKVYNPATALATFNIARVTVGEFRVSGELGNHLPFPKGGATASGIGNPTILQYLRELGLFTGYPVASGETFAITGVHQAGAVVVIEYDLYDAGDITADMPNGSLSSEYQFINYGNTGASISTTATSRYDTQVNAGNFPAFPFDKVVPSGHVMSLHGVLGSTFAPSENDATDDIVTQLLKFTKGQTVLFDEDRNGVAFYEFVGAQSADQVGEGASLIHNLSDTDQGKPWMFDTPLVFNDGDSLLIDVTTLIAGSGQSITIAEQELGLIFSVVGPQRG